MRREFSIIPKKSIGPVLLGMERGEVITILGQPEYSEEAHEKWGIRFPRKDCFFESCLQIRYSEEEKVCDIQASKSSDFIATLEGISVHDSTVSEIASVTEKLGPLNKDIKEYPYIFSYPQLGVSYWRADKDQRYFDTINLVL